MRAAAFGPEIARLLGVRVGRMLMLGWGLAAVLGALAGLLISPAIFLYPNNMDEVLVFGFTGAILGGLDSPVGAVAGGVVVGLGAQLRRRLPRLRPGDDRWPGDPHRGTDGAPAGPVRRPQAAPRMTALRLCGRRWRAMALLRRGRGGDHRATYLLSAYWNYNVAEVAIFTIAAAGLTVLTGINGQLSLGHGALMAVGAYTTALLLKTYPDIPFLLTLLSSIAATGLTGALIGVAAARLRGPYLAGATLALAVGLPRWRSTSAACSEATRGSTSPRPRRRGGSATASPRSVAGLDRHRRGADDALPARQPGAWLGRAHHARRA